MGQVLGDRQSVAKAKGQALEMTERAEPTPYDGPIFGTPWEEVENWLTSLDTAFPLPQPVARDVTQDPPHDRDRFLRPPETPFRDRLRYVNEWCLLNGRIIDRPLPSQRARQAFESKQYQRLSRCDFEIWLTLADHAVRNHRFVKRRARLRKWREPQFWWGRFARMRPSQAQAYSSWHPKRLTQCRPMEL